MTLRQSGRRGGGGGGGPGGGGGGGGGGGKGGGRNPLVSRGRGAGSDLGGVRGRWCM
jgi:hypothetical protein